jgi:CheY-like chemotaxis protein
MARILIVEDDDATARVFTHVLRNAGHAAFPAPTSRAASLAAQAHPDLILLDLGSPDLSWNDVLWRLKREPETARIPVVVVSGEPDAANRLPRDAANGAVAILRKPVGVVQLCTVVDLVVEGWETEARRAHGATLTGKVPLDSQQRALLCRLISRGSHPLVWQVCRRLAADRMCRREPVRRRALSWSELASAGQQEGLLNEGERALLAGRPVPAGAAP